MNIDKNQKNLNMENLLKKLINDKILFKKEVYNAMMQVDRADFINPDYAYYDW